VTAIEGVNVSSSAKVAKAAVPIVRISPKLGFLGFSTRTATNATTRPSIRYLRTDVNTSPREKSILYFKHIFFLKRCVRYFKRFYHEQAYQMSAPVKEDFLEEDPEIRSQKFVLLSFLSPENVLDSKDQFFFGEFVKQYEVDYKIRNLETFLVSIVRGINDKLTKEADKMDASGVDLSGAALTALTEAATLCRKSRLNIGNILETYTGYVKENDKDIRKTTIKDAYDDFMFKNQTKLEEEFFAKNEFRTSIRGLKVRGVTGTHGEAVAMSKKLQRNDTIHNIFLGEVGKWLPWDPKPHQVADQEYAEDQLNTLMKRYKDNEDARDKFVTEQRQELSKGAKKGPVISASDGNPISGESSEGWGAMFGGSDDLALQRKKELSSEAPVNN